MKGKKGKEPCMNQKVPNYKVFLEKLTYYF